MIGVRAIGIVGILGVIVRWSSIDVRWRHVVMTSESAQVGDIDVALSSVLHEVDNA